VGSNGCLTSIGVQRSNINLSIWALKQCGLQRSPVRPERSSFNAAFHDRFNVVRVGLNYRFW
jgi:hypothetical protein